MASVVSGRRGRQAILLVWPLVRVFPWAPTVVAMVLGLLGLLPALLGASAPAAPIWGLRISAVLLGAAASFAVPEPMSLLGVTPTPRWLRQWIRLVVALLPAAAVWMGLFALVWLVVVPARAGMPLGALATEAAVCCLAGLTGAAVAGRRAGATAGLAGPVTQGVLIAGTLFLTGRHSPWVLPSAPSWAAAQRCWSWALPVLVVALAIANRDVWPVAGRARGGVVGS